MKKGLFSHLLSIFLAVIAAVLVVQFSEKDTAPITAPQVQYTFDRVTESGTLRCGYVAYDPWMLIEPNTGEKTGIMVDLTAALAAKLNLKLEWVEEVGWGTFIEALKSRRFDMLCTGGFSTANEGRYVSYSDALFYSGLAVLVRADDTRFDGDWRGLLNNSSLVALGTDGSLDGVFAKELFPNIRLETLPNLTDKSQVMLDVASRKADVTIQELARSERFMAANPGQLKNLTQGQSPRYYPVHYILPLEPDPRLKGMIDTAVLELHVDGTIDRILKKYESQTQGPGSFQYFRGGPYIQR